MTFISSRIIPLPGPSSPGSIGVDTQDSITPDSEDITMKELGDRSLEGPPPSQETAPMTSVFVEAITEVNIKQEGSVIQLEDKAVEDKEGEEEIMVQDS